MIAGTLPLILSEFSSPLVLVFLILAFNEFIKTKGFSSSSLITQGIYLNKSDTEVEFDILLIASPIRLEIDKTSMFFTPLTLLIL